MSPWVAIGVSIVSLAFAIAAFFRAGRWRKQERRESQPNFEVSVEPMFNLTEWSESGPFKVAVARETSRVLVSVHNLSTEAASLNHAAIALRGQMFERQATGTDNLPCRLEGRGGQISWEIPGEDFDGFIGREKSEKENVTDLSFTVYVSMESVTKVHSPHIWRSRLFAVERPNARPVVDPEEPGPPPQAWIVDE